MRPIVNTMLCAFAATGVAAAATGAAARDETRTHVGGRFILQLNGDDPAMVRSFGSGATPTADRHKDQIEIASWSFGATQGVDALTDGLLIVRYNAPPAPGSEKYGAVGGAHRDADIAAPRDAASGQATGKRQHLPIRARSYADQAAAPAEKRQHGWVTIPKPLDRGAVRVKVKSPWLSCTVGARYPKITLGDAARNYLLQDVTVVSCGAAPAGNGSAPTEEVSFNYAKITVRG